MAHRYALSLGVDTLVLGVKNRGELADSVGCRGEARCRLSWQRGLTLRWTAERTPTRRAENVHLIREIPLIRNTRPAGRCHR